MYSCILVWKLVNQLLHDFLYGGVGKSKLCNYPYQSPRTWFRFRQSRNRMICPNCSEFQGRLQSVLFSTFPRVLLLLTHMSMVHRSGGSWISCLKVALTVVLDSVLANQVTNGRSCYWIISRKNYTYYRFDIWWKGAFMLVKTRK